MIGSGEHHGYAGTRHIIGAIGQVGGVHTIAWILSCIGITAIGTTTTILTALSVWVIIIMHIIIICMIVYAAMIMRIAILSVRSLRAMLRAT
jgi:hypothetical protein